jgi:acetoin utilization protein AcuB
MIVSDVMATNVVSIPSTTTLSEARRIMEARHFRRLPVIDRGKLVGIATRDALDRIGPSKMTTFSMHEISYLLNQITVKEIMHRDVVTCPPTMTVEEAVALAQSKQVGAVIVVENEAVVGICTTNDFFYRILNPILGIGIPGSRIVVRNCNDGPNIAKVLSVINNMNIKVTNLFIIDLPETKKHDLIIHLDEPDDNKVIVEIKRLGFDTEDRPR